MTTDHLAQRQTVRQLVAAFQVAERSTRYAFAMLVVAEEHLNAAFTLSGNNPIRIDASGYGYHDDFKNADKAVERMGRQAWRHIVERLELRRMMSVERWERMDKELDKGDLPPITEDNVHAFAQSYLDTMRDMLEEAVHEVFDWLRPHNSAHKTNTELEVGRKVIRTGVVEHTWTGNNYRVVYWHDQYLTALENVFNALDGKGSISKEHYSVLHRAIEECGPNGKGETDLFRFKAYGNGNLHLEFKRLDLLKRFNMIAGGKRLRPKPEDADAT